ncbi:MAG: hypothetical protein AAF745_14425 [Planctomycetota bacterium]
MNHRIASWPQLLLGLAATLVAPTAFGDWLQLPGRFSHDPQTGSRIAQFAPTPTPTSPTAPNFRSSGYTHVRSSLQFGASADNYHRVETWGDPVRPYGEWRFPFRPFSTPYPNWGPPFAGLGVGIGFGGFPGLIPGQTPAVAPIAGNPPPANPAVTNPNTPATPPNNGITPLPYPRGQFFPNPAAGTNGFAPYPAGRGTPYPVAPYYDGFYPNYRQ